MAIFTHWKNGDFPDQALASCLELDGATADDGSLEPGRVTRFIQLLELLLMGSEIPILPTMAV